MPKANPSPGQKKTAQVSECHIRFRAQGYPAHVKKCKNELDVRWGERMHAKAQEKKLRRLETLGARWALALNLYPTLSLIMFSGFLAPRAAIPDEHLDLSDAFATAEPMDLDVGIETSRVLYFSLKSS